MGYKFYHVMFYPKRYSSWPHVCHIILKVSFFFIVMFSYVCCNCCHYFFYLSDLKKPSRQKKREIKRSVIFIAGTDQYGVLITIRLYNVQGNRSTIILKNPYIQILFLKNACILN